MGPYVDLLRLEPRGLEPLTFCMPCRRAPNCAMAPMGRGIIAGLGRICNYPSLAQNQRKCDQQGASVEIEGTRIEDRKLVANNRKSCRGLADTEHDPQRIHGRK